MIGTVPKACGAGMVTAIGEIPITAEKGINEKGVEIERVELLPLDTAIVAETLFNARVVWPTVTEKLGTVYVAVPGADFTGTAAESMLPVRLKAALDKFSGSVPLTGVSPKVPVMVNVPFA